MAHFARIENETVMRVHVVDNAVITDAAGIEHEALGQAFLADLHGGLPSDYLQCSYNGNMRGKYPSAGFVYDADLDEFVSPQADEPADE